MTGTIPNIHARHTVLLPHNLLSGTIPDSMLNLSLTNFILHDNNLSGEIPRDLCSKVDLLAVDDSSWFLDEPLITCPCCDKAKCNMWHNDEINIVGGTRKPHCPKSNIFKRNIFEFYEITDDVANVRIKDFIGLAIEGEMNLCLSPTGCFTLKHDIVNGKNDLDETWDKEYKVGLSSASKTLEERETCDAVDVCGVLFGPDHPKRMRLNHLTHVILPDLSILDDPLLPEYKALCWIMTQDLMFHDYDVCDGKLLQRYIMAFFYYSFQRSFGFDALRPVHTCEWHGVRCDPDDKFIEHIDFSSNGLEGTFVTEIGLLTRLKTLVLSHNSLGGTIDPITFEFLPNLEVFNISSNTFRGTLPKTLVQLPQIEEIIFSNNLIVGELPGDIEYSKSISELFLNIFVVECSLFSFFLNYLILPFRF